MIKFSEWTARGAVIAGLVLALRVPLAAEAYTFVGRVVGVSDGDTITVMHDRKGEKVRLWGVDSPEKRQPYGAKAKQFTSQMTFDTTVRVEAKNKDRYGRMVANVYRISPRSTGGVKAADLCLNRELVEAGLAWWYRQYAPKDKELERLELEARAAKRGLWADPQPVAPWDWRVHQRKIGTAPRITYLNYRARMEI